MDPTDILVLNQEVVSVFELTCLDVRMRVLGPSRKYSMVQYSTVQYSMHVQGPNCKYSMAQYSMVQYSTVQHACAGT